MWPLGEAPCERSVKRLIARVPLPCRGGLLLVEGHLRGGGQSWMHPELILFSSSLQFLQRTQGLMGAP